MNESDHGVLKMRLLETMTAAACRRNNGADHLHENVRYAFLIDRDQVSFAEATAQRVVTEDGASRDRILQNLPVVGRSDAQ